ncbi:beta/gamma crystallin domain-containing protein 1-like isoform X1 [Sander lucioperca]|uniref:beta/gamma crystallin domain-containing protein 1-like isoform X1 n=1 Tax=Sander lucioperca TaxID=283035 RepID=UPI00165344A3|nr:beta/gamma crystallin domain-containing protein 1-like isoform X1 [Sander lucioperca]XP_035851391.1 beta/gamma crystallin domain-containing protein 1-like isoform X1 [Sander lucioperca]
MFTTYIKNLNDMVFSTSESPEEQQSTGVLGRIGSWLSPWRVKGPKSPTENAPPTSDQAVKSEGEEESEESVRLCAGEQWEEEKEQSSNPNPLCLPRDIFPCEEEDATQSAHRDGAVVSRTETAEGGPKKEEFVECRKKRVGQGKEREESSNGTSASGNLEKNASHLTHFSSSSEQGVVWDSEWAHTQLQAQRQAQAQTGRRLHVYLEETSVIHCGQNSCSGQEVVQTKVTKKNLKVLGKAKSSPGFDLNLSSTSAENKRTDVKRTYVRPAVEAQSYNSALVGVSLKSRKDSQSKPEPEEQTEADSMGRKNTARRKYRKNSQEDGADSSQEKVPPSAQPVPEGIPTSDNSVTSPQGKSPKTDMGESSVNSSSKHNPTPQASPEGAESKTSSSDTVQQLDNFQESNSVIAATLACVDGGTDMEDDDSLYKVERRTETPESKRRSMKVSQSEVKFFTKYVPLNPKQNPTGDTQELKAAFKNNEDEAKDKPKTEIDTRLHKLKKMNEEPKPVVGRLADKISLFERPAAKVSKQTFQTQRSADVSPVRKATERPKADFVSSDQRSNSAERYGMARSSSASPIREKPMTIKERARNFTEASKTEDMAGLPQTPAMKGMKAMCVAVAASKSPELDHQGRLDTKEQIQEAKSEITLKPDGQDTTAVGVKISISKEQPTSSKTNDTVASKTADQGTKPNSVETNVSSKGPGDSAELTNSISPQSKGPSRTGSRSKRRKSREPTSPISPNSEKKQDCFTNKPELTAIKQQQVDDTEEGASAAKQVSLPSKKAQGNTSDKQIPETKTKQKAFKKELEVLDIQKKQLDSSFKKENIDKPVSRQEGLPEPSVNKDEPDTAVHSSETKTPIDKDPGILPQKEEKAGGHCPLFTQRRDKASKDSRETAASSPSPAVERPTETSSMEQEPPVERSKLDKELSMQSESKSKAKVSEANNKDTGQTLQPQNKDIELTNQAESKDVDKLEKVEGEKTNQAERKSKEKPQQLLHSEKNTTKAEVSDSRQGISGTEGKADERKNAERKDETQLVKAITKPETNQAEQVSQSSEKNLTSDLSAQKQHVGNTKTTHPEKAAVCAVTQTNEAVCVSKSEKGSSKEEKATHGPPELQTKAAESPETETGPVVIAEEPQPHSVEKTDNSPDDSCAHGANDAQFSSSKSITKATTAAEKVTVKAAGGTPALITAQTDKMSEKELSVKESTPISVSKSASSKGAGQDDEKETDKSVPSEVKVSGDVMKLALQCEELRKTKSTSDKTPLKGSEIIAQSPSDSAAFSSTVNVVKKTAEKTFHSPIDELSPVANGDIFPHQQLHTVKKELVNNKPSQTPKAPTSPQANKPIPDSTQRSTMKKLHLPRGLSKDDSATRQDAPSSWLDVDFPKRRLKVPVPKLSSSGSESNLLDTSGELDDDDFVEKIKKLCSPFSLPPRKHNQLRQPQPPFAMPAIREDRFEKTFDPEEFKFGLRKKNQFTVDTTPGLLAKLQNKETKSGLKPARASLADRSMLLSSLDTHSRLRDKTPVKDEEDVKEEKDDQVKVKSRLEGSCVLSSLTSSILRGKRNGFQTQAEGTNSGDVSPSEAPQLSPPPLTHPPPPSPTAAAPLKDTLALSNREEAQAVVSDSGPPLPSFNDIKLPDYLEKYLPREPVKPVQSIQGQQQFKTKVIEKMATPASGGEADLAVKPGPVLPDAVLPCFPEIPSIPSTLPELKQPSAQPQGRLSENIRTAKGFHKRPGKMVLFEKAQFSGQAHEIYRDVADATSLQLSPLISVKVVRGCWVLYEKPDFQGRSIALEEGGIELTNVWAEPGLETEPQNNPSMLIGSIRLAVWDYSLPHIDLFTEPEGRGRVTPYHNDTIETGSFGIPLSTASIQVHSGVWLVFSDPGFQGMIAVLETGEYPFPETWGFPSPFVGSLRPLKMGGFKVENPNEVKAVVYEKPGLEGFCLEIDSDVFSFCESEAIAADGANFDSTKLNSVGSLKIIGGLWVGYSEPGFEGQQHILEEGEYLDCSDWGGSEQLLSLRPILADFMSSHLKMFSNIQFGELGVNIDLTVPVINMDDTGYGMKTQSVDVMGGVWVVFEEPGFCGECYILEKGLYGSPEDWGALQPRVASVMPVVLDDFENTAKFKVQLFSEPGFQGSVLPLEDSVASLQDGVSVASCKVLAGSWLAFEGQDFTGRMYVLEMGSYPDLSAMGCVNASCSILSLQTVGFEFSLPSITLFERCGLWGKRVVLTDGSVNLQLAGGCTRVQSVLVEGGMWVLYEGINYRGPQILLKPGEVPDWRKFSSWQKIGSLRPLLQKRVHFRLRNRQTGLMMSVTGDLDDVKLLRIQETEETDEFEQIWFYQNGHLHCKLLEECCLSPSGSVTIAGSRVGLTPEPDNQIHLWSITPEGFISYTPTSDLVLDIKGGHHYDKNQVILQTLDPSKLQQRWDVEII